MITISGNKIHSGISQESARGIVGSMSAADFAKLNGPEGTDAAIILLVKASGGECSYDGGRKLRFELPQAQLSPETVAARAKRSREACAAYLMKHDPAALARIEREGRLVRNAATYPGCADAIVNNMEPEGGRA